MLCNPCFLDNNVSQCSFNGFWVNTETASLLPDPFNKLDSSKQIFETLILMLTCKCQGSFIVLS